MMIKVVIGIVGIAISLWFWLEGRKYNYLKGEEITPVISGRFSTFGYIHERIENKDFAEISPGCALTVAVITLLLVLFV